MPRQIANQYKPHVQRSWNNLPSSVRQTTTPEAHAKSWLEENVDTLSKSTLTIVASIIAGELIDV